MKNYNNYPEIIEKYLEGTLSASEREDFEDRLKKDPKLSEELSSRQLIQENWVKATRKVEVRNHIRRVIKTEKSGLISRNLFWLSVAASFLIILGISSLYFYQRGQNVSDREFLSNGNNSLSKESFITGKQAEIKEYGSIEYAGENRNIAFNRLLPKNGAIYQATDTITFVWPAASFENEEPLIITDENGEKVVEIKLRNGAIGYKLLPSRLKPGTYTYILQPKALNYKFSIVK